MFCGENTQLLKSVTQHFWKMSSYEIRVPCNLLRHITQLTRSLARLVTHRGLCTTWRGTADVYVTKPARQTPAVVYWLLMTSWAELL